MRHSKYFKWLSLIDIFGAKIELNFRQEKYFNSIFGGISTLLMVVTILSMFSSQVYVFSAKSKISVEKQSFFQETPERIVLNQNNFWFYVGIEQPNTTNETSFIQRPFYNITLLQRTYNSSEEGKRQKFSQEMPLVPCNDEKFKDFLCPLPNFELILEGAFVSDTFSFITVQVTECNQKLADDSPFWNPTCENQSVIRKYVAEEGSFRLQFYSRATNVNAEEKTEVYWEQYIAEDLHFKFRPNVTSPNADVFFENFIVETDESLFVHQEIDRREFVYRVRESVKETMTVYSSNQGKDCIEPCDVIRPEYIKLNLRSDNQKSFAQRKYMKVDELISYLGGIINVFLLVFGLIVTFYNEHKLYLQLAKQLYRFKHSEKQTLKEDYINKESLENYAEQGFPSKIALLYHEFEQIIKKGLPLNFVKYCVFILSFKRLFRNEKNLMIGKAIHKVKKKMNIEEILRSNQNVDDLKNLIFNESQQKIFNFYPKPELKMDKRQLAKALNRDVPLDVSKDSISPKKRKIQKKLEKKQNDFNLAVLAYQELITQESTDETTNLINCKLIHYLGMELRNVMNISAAVRYRDLKKSSERRQNFEKLIVSQKIAEQKVFKQIMQSEIVRESAIVQNPLFENFKTDPIKSPDNNVHFQQQLQAKHKPIIIHQEREEQDENIIIMEKEKENSNL